MAHGMLWDLPGETVIAWTVIVTAAALRKYTEKIIAHLFFFYIYFYCVFYLLIAGILYLVFSLMTVCQCSITLHVNT